MTGQNVAVFNFDGKFDVRVAQGDEPLFVAKDVAEALGYANTTQAVRTHCKHAKSLSDIGALSGALSGSALDPQTKLIPESDVFRLTMKSTLASAERFQDWVFEEVLPSIRKTGGYSVSASATVPRQDALDAAKFVLPFMDAAERFGFVGNQAILSANKAIKAVLDVDILELMGQKALIAPDQESLLTVTEIEQRLGWKRQDGNKKLTALGLQTDQRDHNNKLKYELTEDGKKFGVYLDTGKQYSNGTPIRQIKWRESVIDVLKKAESLTLSFISSL